MTPLLSFSNIDVQTRPTLLDNRRTLRNTTTLDDNRSLIQGASGQLGSGQLTMLTGGSGSGKSVLLRVLAGLVPMSAGDIWLHDDQQRIHIDQMQAPKWRTQVALLAQHPELIEGSVLDNLTLPYTLQAHKGRPFDKAWHIEQLRLLQRDAAFLQQSAVHLSGGERQLVNTLRLLQLQPRVLLLDEPTAALDIETANQLVQLLTSWQSDKPRRTLLWVTHDTQTIGSLANQHWRMHSGVLTNADL